jgi:hypothetical protein
MFNVGISLTDLPWMQIRPIHSFGGPIEGVS